MKLLKKHIIKTLFLHRFRKNNLFLITLCNMTHEASPYHRGTAGLCADFSSRFFSQSTTRWTVWCRRPSSASSWRRSDITLCSSLRTNGESVSSNESPSASLWLQRASAVSWEFSWSPRCSQGSFKIGSWGKPGLKVGEGGHLWMFFVSSLWLLTPDSQFPPKSPGLTLTSSGRQFHFLPPHHRILPGRARAYCFLEYWNKSSLFSWFNFQFFCWQACLSRGWNNIWRSCQTQSKVE